MNKYFTLIWSNLTVPHPRINEQEKRVSSAMFSAYLIISLPLGVMFLLSLKWIFDDGLGFTIDFILFGIFLILLVGIYGINRAGYFDFAIIGILSSAAIFIFLEAILDQDLVDLIYLLLPRIVAGLFLREKLLVLIGSFYISGVIACLFLPFGQQIILLYVLPQLIMGIILIIVTCIHRNRFEILRKQELLKSEFRYTLAAEAVNDGLWDWDIIKNEFYYSSRWKSLMGLKNTDNSLKTWLNRIYEQDRQKFEVALQNHLKNESYLLKVEFRIFLESGEFRWMVCRGLAARDSEGKAYQMAGSLTDITDTKLAEERLAYSALHDGLTGLPNRLMFMDRLKQKIEYLKQHPNDLFAVLFLDLDHFKTINDSLGHSVGDKLLIATTRRIQSCLRTEDTVARIGGDEFAILLESIKSQHDAVRVAERIQTLLSKISIYTYLNQISTVSVGITTSIQQYNSPEDMLRDADYAMYLAKSQGGNKHQVFYSEVHQKAIELLQLEIDLKHALKNGELVVYYEPIVSVRNGQILGVEALVRWCHPTRGLILPLEFIPIAEETGLITSIGNFVLETACQQLMAWQEYCSKDMWVSVNISSRQFQNHTFINSIHEILQKTGLPSKNLRLEITESVAMKDITHSKQLLKELSRIGIRVSLDDFGIGYSSLNYLNQLPISVIKIDYSFLKGIGKNESSEAIVEAIISLAHTLGHTVVAEGVESEKQFAFLNSKFCDEAQGYLFGKAMLGDILCKTYKDAGSFSFLSKRSY